MNLVVYSILLYIIVGNWSYSTELT